MNYAIDDDNTRGENVQVHRILKPLDIIFTKFSRGAGLR